MEKPKTKVRFSHGKVGAMPPKSHDCPPNCDGSQKSTNNHKENPKTNKKQKDEQTDLKNT